MKKVNERIEKIIFPSTATGCKASFLSEPGNVNPTHAWHEYGTKNIMIYLLRDCMGDKTWKEFVLLVICLNHVSRYDITENEAVLLIEDMKLALSLMERDFPLSFSNITLHLLVHMAESLKKKGPAHSRWMFPFERLNSVISRQVKSRKHPEVSCIRAIQLMDWIMDVIMTNRLNVVKTETPEKAIEKILMKAGGYLDDQTNRRKRRAQLQLTPEECQQIMQLLQKSDLENDHVNNIEWIKSERCNDLGSLIYEVRGSKSDKDFRKSSRYIYLNTENRFGEIVGIYEHFEDDKELIWVVVEVFVHHDTDYETALPFAIIDSSNRCRYVCTVHDLSEPLIVAIDNTYMVFIH